MAAAFRSSSNTTYASRTNTTITAPAGITNGDVLILLFWGFNLSSITLPTGFTQLAGSPVNNSGPFSTYMAYKVASGESGNYLVTHGTFSTQGAIVCVSGGETGSAPTCTFNTGTGATTTALSVTTTTNSALIIYAGTSWAGLSGLEVQPVGTTPLFSQQIDDSGGTMYVATGVLATAGATGNKSNGNNNGASDPWTGILAKVEAAGAATAPGDDEGLTYQRILRW